MFIIFRRCCFCRDRQSRDLQALRYIFKYGMKEMLLEEFEDDYISVRRV